MFEPRHLKAYLALVKCMHFGRAAEMLGISQPTLSQQIRMLEEAVGAPLINRSNRTMELTPVGRVFAEDAQQILTLMERAKRNAEDILSGEEAEVKLGVCPGTDGRASKCSRRSLRPRIWLPGSPKARLIFMPD